MSDGPRRAFFDLWSRVYDVPVVQWSIYRPVQQVVMEELGRLRFRRLVLDIGCGTGILAKRLDRESDVEVVVGCDFSMGMLRRASRRRGGPLLQTDARQLPVPAGSVDAIVSTEAFHWFPEPLATLEEFRRALRPGGRLLVGMVNMRSSAASRTAGVASAALGGRVHWPTATELAAEVEQSGLHVIRQRRVIRVGGLALPTVVTVAERT